jgi:hypothetical protein
MTANTRAFTRGKLLKVLAESGRTVDVACLTDLMGTTLRVRVPVQYVQYIHYTSISVRDL